VNNADVAAALTEVAELLELKNESGFRIRAYENAAKALGNQTEDVRALVASGELVKIKGIGAGIARTVEELVSTGQIEYLEQLRSEFPEGVRRLMSVPGVGPSLARREFGELGVTNLDELRAAAEDGRVDSTPVRIYGADPDNGPSRELARYAWAAAVLYNPTFAVLPVFRLDRISRGGDHSPFVTLKDPGIRFSEKLENYKRQHLPGDKMEFVNFGYVANVARLNAATLGALASAPPVPDSVTAKRDAPSGGQKWMLAWKPSPGAVSYEVLVRHTTSPTYEKAIPVRGATSYLLADQLDDLWASVRSVGANGQRSLAVVVPPPTFVTR